MTSKCAKPKNELLSLEVEIEDNSIPEEEEEEYGEANPKPDITSHLCLKTGDCHPSEKVDREVILRRIRHRRRVNKVKSAVQALFSSPFSTTATTSSTNKVSAQPPQKWVDDAFAAP